MTCNIFDASDEELETYAKENPKWAAQTLRLLEKELTRARLDTSEYKRKLDLIIQAVDTVRPLEQPIVTPQNNPVLSALDAKQSAGADVLCKPPTKLRWTKRVLRRRRRTDIQRNTF